MKTQNFGFVNLKLKQALDCALASPRPSVRLALKNYQKNRENGSSVCAPQQLLPSGGLEDCEDFYEEFDWEKDEERGYPTQDSKGKRERYWFIVKHKQSSLRIEGFYQEPNYGKGYPDKGGHYHVVIVFTDTENSAIRAWEVQKDLNHLEYAYENDRELYNREIADLKRQNDPNGILPLHEARQRERGIVIGDEPQISLANLSQRVATLEEQVEGLSISGDVGPVRQRSDTKSSRSKKKKAEGPSLSSSEAVLPALSEASLQERLAQAQQHAEALQSQLTEFKEQHERHIEQQQAELEKVNASIIEYKQQPRSSQGPSPDVQAALTGLYQRQQQLTQVLLPLHEKHEQQLQRQQQLAYITGHPNDSIQVFYDVVFRRLNRLFLMLSIASTQAFVLRKDTWQHLIFGGEQLVLGVAEQLIDVLALAGEAVPLVSPGIKLLAGIAKGLYNKYRDYQIKLGAASLDGSLVNNEYLAQEVAMLLAYRYEPALTGLMRSQQHDDAGHIQISPDSVEMLGLYAAGKIIKGLLSGKVPAGLTGDNAISALLQLVSEEKLKEHTIMIRVGFIEQAVRLPGMQQRLTRENGTTICAESLLRKKTGIMMRDENPATDTVTIYLRRPLRQDVSDEDVARYGYRWTTAKEIASSQFILHHQPIVASLSQPGNAAQSSSTHYSQHVIAVAERLSKLPDVALIGDSEAAKQRAKEIEEQQARAKRQAEQEKKLEEAKQQADEKAKKHQDKQSKKPTQSNQSGQPSGSGICSSSSLTSFPGSAADNDPADDDTLADALSTFPRSDSVQTFSHGELRQSDSAWNEMTDNGIMLEDDNTWLQDTALPTAIDSRRSSQSSSLVLMKSTQQQLDEMSQRTEQQLQTLAKQQQEHLSALSIVQSRSDAKLQITEEALTQKADVKALEQAYARISELEVALKNMTEEKETIQTAKEKMLEEFEGKLDDTLERAEIAEKRAEQAEVSAKQFKDRLETAEQIATNTQAAFAQHQIDMRAQLDATLLQVRQFMSSAMGLGLIGNQQQASLMPAPMMPTPDANMPNVSTNQAGMFSHPSPLMSPSQAATAPANQPLASAPESEQVAQPAARQQLPATPTDDQPPVKNDGDSKATSSQSSETPSLANFS